MSVLVGNALPQFILTFDDRLFYEGSYLGLASDPIIPILQFDPDPLESGLSFRNEWWPPNNMLIGVDSISDLAMEPQWTMWPVSGANGRLGIVGYTRDYAGAPMPGATVKLFRTVDDSLQSTVLSDALGRYSITTPYSDGHYLVVYKAGPPDIAGTTVNTLTPA